MERIDKTAFRAIALWVSALVLFFTVGTPVFLHPTSQWDFVSYFDAGLTARLGLDPYDTSALEQSGLRHSVLPMCYLPLFTYAFSAFARLPLAVASWIWIVLKCIALLLLFRLVSREFVRISPRNGWDLAFCVFAFNSTLLWDLASGNVTIFVLVPIWLAFDAYLKNQFWRFTFLVVLGSLVKFHPMVFLLLLPLQLGALRSLRYLLAGFGALGMFILANYWLFPAWMPGFFRNSSSQISEMGIQNPSALSLVRAFLLSLKAMSSMQSFTGHIDLWIAWLIYGALVLLIGGLSWRAVYSAGKRLDPKIAVFFSCLVYVLLIPRVKSYDFITAIPASLYILRKQQPKWIPLLGFLFCIQYLSPVPESPEVSMSSLGGPIMGLFRLAYEYSPWFAALGAWWLLVAEITSRKAQALDPEPAAIQIEALAQESNVS